MSDSKSTHTDISEDNPNKGTCQKQEKSKEFEIIPPQPSEILRQKPGNLTLRTNLPPPELAFATLPHISSDERKMLIGEIGKENERMFKAFQIKTDLENKNSIRDKIFSISIILIIIGVMIFLLLIGKDQYFEKILTVLLSAFGGSGVILIYLRKKNNQYSREE